MKIIIFCILICSIKKCSGLCDSVSKDVNETTLTIYNTNFRNGTPLVTGNITPSNKINILIHEWFSNNQTKWITESIPNILRTNPNNNIIVIDYSPYANNPYFIKNTCTSPYVGIYIANKLIEMKVDASLISCTGHSLGAQVCGALARHFIEQNAGQIAQITGLDAFGLTFDENNNIIMFASEKALSKDDAKRVVGIYSDSSGWGLGMSQDSNYSHVSIIINAGYKQPACKSMFFCPITKLITFGQTALSDCVFCSQRFSREIYQRAIAGEQYNATKCDDYDNFKDGRCNGNSSFVYTDPLDSAVSDGVYYMSINSTFNQIGNTETPE